MHVEYLHHETGHRPGGKSMCILNVGHKYSIFIHRFLSTFINNVLSKDIFGQKFKRWHLICICFASARYMQQMYFFFSYRILHFLLLHFAFPLTKFIFSFHSSIYCYCTNLSSWTPPSFSILASHVKTSARQQDHPLSANTGIMDKPPNLSRKRSA